MSITDELREAAHYMADPTHDFLPLVVSGDLDNIADRIDAEHEKATAGCIHYDPERHYCAVHGDTENGWVRLPVDADGVPLRVGDEIEYPNGARDTVRFATISPIGWAVNDRGWKPEAMRHYTPPTVEDVLRAFAQEMNENMGMYTSEAIDADEWRDADGKTIAEYAAKLRLAGDGE